MPKLYSRVLVPPAVVQELERGRIMGIALPDIVHVPWIEVHAPRDLGTVSLPAGLGTGEREILALGIQLSSAVLILDDRSARRSAGALGLSYTGTLGILMRAKNEGLIAAIKPAIVGLEALGFRLSAPTRAAVLKQSGEFPFSS